MHAAPGFKIESILTNNFRANATTIELNQVLAYTCLIEVANRKCNSELPVQEETTRHFAAVAITGLLNQQLVLWHARMAYSTLLAALGTQPSVHCIEVQEVEKTGTICSLVVVLSPQ